MGAARDGRGGGTGWLTGCYLHRSAALGGWHPDRSDVDLLLVVSRWSAAVSEVVTAALTSPDIRCPGTGLECSVVTAAAAGAPEAPWPFLLHVSTSTVARGDQVLRGAGDEVRVVDGAAMPGDPDLLMRCTIARRRGITVSGVPAAVAFGEVPRDEVLRYLHDELDRGLERADEPYVVLNALRAAEYVRRGDLVSKRAAALAAVDDPDLPSGLARRVLAAQSGEAPPGRPGHDAVLVVRRVQTLLAAALAARRDGREGSAAVGDDGDSDDAAGR